jgi:hypothetical protein
LTKCQRCAKPAKTNFKHLGELCCGCYCKAIEKRIRKYVRINKIFRKGDSIMAVGELNHHLITRIIEGLPARVIYRKTAPKNAKQGQKVVQNWTLDDEACDFLKSLLNKKQMKKRRIISILRCATDSELEAFSRFRKLNFTPNKKDMEIMKGLNMLEGKHAETKFSLAKSIEQISKIRQ